MKRGRDEKEHFKEMTERGIPGTKSNDTNFAPMSFGTLSSAKSSFANASKQ
jgi:hypothetical protein